MGTHELIRIIITKTFKYKLLFILEKLSQKAKKELKEVVIKSSLTIKKNVESKNNKKNTNVAFNEIEYTHYTKIKQKELKTTYHSIMKKKQSPYISSEKKKVSVTDASCF